MVFFAQMTSTRYKWFILLQVVYFTASVLVASGFSATSYLLQVA